MDTVRTLDSIRTMDHGYSAYPGFDNEPWTIDTVRTLDSIMDHEYSAYPGFDNEPWTMDTVRTLDSIMDHEYTYHEPGVVTSVRSCFIYRLLTSYFWSNSEDIIIGGYARPVKTLRSVAALTALPRN
ncbi:hypothetical protein JTE90_018422 [Oedothorax gibbosus]|uniref:Uncharacterized protein n=1 Tax=Oedothorax gibbosus TaxID=931172 RepID=A0AAV6TXX0_9ARAC|nr:hypothetical protein JTE90_018422 [Oedothorax gibbosus]